jgi:hypothetical protein
MILMNILVYGMMGILKMVNGLMGSGKMDSGLQTKTTIL